jgi:hypothetical protein
MAVTNKGYAIIGVIVLLVIVGIGYAASQGAPNTKKSQVDGQVTITVNKAIGIDYVIINNLDANTGDFKVSFIQLPYSFNCSTGDTIIFTGVTQKGYIWNGWEFNTGHPVTDNPLIITSDDSDYTIKGTMIITPNCFRLNPTPSPTPSPSPTPHPTPTPNPDSQLVSVRTLEYR